MQLTEAEMLDFYGNPLELSSKTFGKSSVNNGGSTDYYKLDLDWTECGDIIEARNMNYNQGNILKAAFAFNIGRHSGTTYERELNKIIYFAQRELTLLDNNKGTK